MKILYPPELISALKNKYLLLDTNIFIDAAIKPTIFTNFFNDLKKSNITLTTIDLVKYEVLKGTADEIKYSKREKHINDILDATLLITSQTLELVYGLIKNYKTAGSSLSTTDLLLGATLIQYKKNIYLITRDTTDFIQNVFNLAFIINAPHPKGIFTYGIYQSK